MQPKQKLSDGAKALDRIVENALIEAGPGATIRSIAERVVRDNPEEIENLKDEWILEGVSRAAVRIKADLSRAERSKQIPLPGFERIPLKLSLGEKRKPKALLKATHWELRTYLARLRKRQAESPRIAQVKALMELIGKWKKKLRTTRQLTVEEVMQREAGYE